MAVVTTALCRTNPMVCVQGASSPCLCNWCYGRQDVLFTWFKDKCKPSFEGVWIAINVVSVCMDATSPCARLGVSAFLDGICLVT